MVASSSAFSSRKLSALAHRHLVILRTAKDQFKAYLVDEQRLSSTLPTQPELGGEPPGPGGDAARVRAAVGAGRQDRGADRHALSGARGAHQRGVISFLPAKPGVGTSTLALNTAIALSKIVDNNVLLADLDLNSGLIGFMLKLDNVYTIYEAAKNADKLDEHLWPQLVASHESLDVLPAGRLDPQTRIEPSQVRTLLSFARRFYEIPSLHLARQKFQLLSGMDLSDRVAVLLNRSQKRSIITPAQIEQLLGVPVHMEFPNDYQGVHKALTTGRAVETQTELGKQFVQLS